MHSFFNSRRMGRKTLAWAACVMVLSGPILIKDGHAGEGRYSKALVTVMRQLLDDTDAPGAGVIVVTSDRVLALATEGISSTETELKLTDDSLWHIGSMAKAMTAEALLRSVESPWTYLATPMGELAPAIGVNLPKSDITMDHLLSHRAGVERDVPASSWAKINAGENIREQRRAYANSVSDAADKQIGNFSYSNAGYVIATAITEEALDTSWEEMMTTQVFQRLSLSTAGFLAPGYPGKGIRASMANRGHVLQDGYFWWDDDEFVPVNNDRSGDLPVAMAPAGGVHLSLRDMGVFLQSHLQGLISKDPFYEELHRPREDVGDYAMGWIVRNDIHFHNGSNLRWLSEMYLYPDHDIAFSIHLNHGDADRGLGFIDALSAAIRAEHEAATGVRLAPMTFEWSLGSK